MDNTMVINLTNITQHVGVVHADGTKDKVQIMPKRRAFLRVGMSVDKNWIGKNIGVVRVIEATPVETKIAQPVQVQSLQEAKAELANQGAKNNQSAQEAPLPTDADKSAPEQGA